MAVAPEHPYSDFWLPVGIQGAFAENWLEATGDVLVGELEVLVAEAVVALLERGPGVGGHLVEDLAELLRAVADEIDVGERDERGHDAADGEDDEELTDEELVASGVCVRTSDGQQIRQLPSHRDEVGDPLGDRTAHLHHARRADRAPARHRGQEIERFAILEEEIRRGGGWRRGRPTDRRW